jgi:hypothetical protein
VKRFTAEASGGGDPDLVAAGARAAVGGTVVKRLDAAIAALFSWGVLGWATALLYALFLLR